MLTSVVLCFFIGYIIIVLEQPLKLDKSVPALLMGALTWALISVGNLEVLGVNHQVTPLEDGLLHIMGKTAEILFFLLGAMTIVELVDLHKGFSPITSLVKTKDKKALLWITSLIAFFLSAVLDNLTTTIVMISILRKLIPTREDRLFYVSLIIIAANAGGAWSPIGDVTTTMLWIGKKVSSVGLMQNLFLPSIISLVLPVFIASLLPIFKGKIENIPGQGNSLDNSKLLSSKTMLIAGLAGLIFVPIFKSVTHLPPYMGIMISLGIVWLISEYIHPEEEFNQENRHLYSVHKALSRIEISSIIFFLGILLAVGALESVVVQSSTGEKVGFLMSLANKLQELIPNQNMVIIFIGILSAVIDNVPLVAATMGMYPMDKFPMDSNLWHFIAYSAGTGGSMLVIGSAAGVAAMGMEKIDFIWYFKNISWLAFIGFIAGCLTFIALT
ncbi:MAG: sodium:proton antiporter NhaD [Saprospiraceae bacterium]|jgi:Na+/H+ antiporter NhaD/arsenite permease-like protein